MIEPPLPPGRLAGQVRFLLEADLLKSVLRRTFISDGSRHENSAEHSWHAALFALVLSEHAHEPVELGRVVAMLVLHDLVEIDAGDTYVYDDAELATKAAREQAAADRLFDLLPPDQAGRLRHLWEEFDARVTADSRFANAVDRLTAVLLNYVGRGGAWQTHGVSAPQVRARNTVVGEAAPPLGELVSMVVEDSVTRGWLPEGTTCP